MTIGWGNVKSSMTKNKISFSGVVKMKAWNGEVKRVCDQTWSNENEMMLFLYFKNFILFFFQLMEAYITLMDRKD